MRITQPATGQVTFSLCQPKTQVRFAAEPEQTESEPYEFDSLTSSQHDHPESCPQEKWEKVPLLKQAESDDSAELIERPKPADYVSWCHQQDQKEREAIGRRFFFLGRTVNAVENEAKALSRKVIGQTKDLVDSTRKATCRQAAQLLRKAAQALDSRSES